jgi:diguanylate cyclase (GGDEF)-like protein
MLFKDKTIRNILILSFLILISFSFYDIFIAYPSFVSALKEDAKDESIRTAKHLISMTALGEETLQVDPNTIETLRKDFNLLKIKVFSPSGKITYSTDPNDIGNANKKNYFHEIVAKGNSYAKIVEKETKSLEGQLMNVDNVETYVPIMKDGRFLGAFEIYYDVTIRKEKLNKLIISSSSIVIAATFIFLFAISLLSVKAKRAVRDRNKLEEKLKTLSLSDDLTGIYNRRGFFVLTEQLLMTAKRQEKKLFMLYADIDHLKLINDLLGHKKGDLVLIRTANVLKETFRESDIIARIGGDEFVVFGMNTHDTEIEILASRLRENIYKHNEIVNEPLTDISLSYGFVRYDHKPLCSIDELISKADNLMYEEKRCKQKAYA